MGPGRLEALRQHLIDMNEVTLKANAAPTPVDGDRDPGAGDGMPRHRFPGPVRTRAAAWRAGVLMPASRICAKSSRTRRRFFTRARSGLAALLLARALFPPDKTQKSEYHTEEYDEENGYLVLISLY